MGTTFNKNMRLAGQNFKQPESTAAQPATIRTPTSYLITRNPETGGIEKTPRTWKEEPAPVAPKPETKPNPFQMVDIGGRKMPAVRVNPWAYVNKG